MPSRWMSLAAGACACVLLAGCSGDDGDRASPGKSAQTTAVPTTSPMASPLVSTTKPPIDGVQTYQVEAGHSEGPVSYPVVPPVGGIHNPMWQPCGFYDQPVQNDRGVHSLEHGAIWITFRPDLPRAEIDSLAALARSRNYILVSRWESGLPSPLVATGWGRQLRLESATDPRLAEFIRLYAGQGPEPNAPC